MENWELGKAWGIRRYNTGRWDTDVMLMVRLLKSPHKAAMGPNLVFNQLSPKASRPPRLDPHVYPRTWSLYGPYHC